jgi:hypothetical protein
MQHWVLPRYKKAIDDLLVFASFGAPHVDDQIWQDWKSRTVRFAKPEYPILAVFRAKPRNELNLKI